MTARSFTSSRRRQQEFGATVWSIGSFILILMITRMLSAAVGA